LLPEDLKKWDLYITPWLGMALVVTVLFPLSWMGYSVAGVINWFALSVLFLNFVVWALYKERVFFEKSDLFLLVLLGFVAATLYCGALYVRGYDIYSITHNDDIASYLNDARAALESSARHMAGLPAGTPDIKVIDFSLNLDLRGCVFVQAFFAALYKMELIHISYILSAFVMFLSFAAFRPFLGDARKTAAAAAIALLPLNAFYQNLITFSFIGQLYSVGFVVVCFRLASALSSRESFDPRTAFSLVFMMTANGLNYIEAAAFPLVPVGVIFTMGFLPGNRRPRLKNSLFAGALYGALNIPVFVRLVKVFFLLDTSEAGWPMEFVTLADVAGIKGALSPSALWFAVVIIANAAVAAVLFWQLRKEGFFSFISLSCLFYAILHAAFCLRYYEPGEASSYSAFKSALSLSFVLLIPLLRFLAGSIAAPPDGFAPRRLGFLIYAALLAFGCAGSFDSFRGFYERPKGAFTADYEILRDYAAAEKTSGADFIINCDRMIYVLGASYYAPLGRAYSCAYGTAESGRMRNMKPSFAPGDVYIASMFSESAIKTTDAPPLYSNAVYSVYRLGENSVILSDYEGLSHRIEVAFQNYEPRFVKKVTGQTVKFELMAIRGGVYDFEAVFTNGETHEPLSVKAFFNGQPAGTFSREKNEVRCFLAGIPISAGKNEVTFEFTGDAGRAVLSRLNFARPVI
jgi:hypothetical protein